MVYLQKRISDKNANGAGDSAVRSLLFHNGAGNTFGAYVYNKYLKRKAETEVSAKIILKGRKAYENCIFQHKTL